MVAAFHRTSQMIPAFCMTTFVLDDFVKAPSRNTMGLSPLWRMDRDVLQVIICANGKSCITFKHINMGQFVVWSWINYVGETTLKRVCNQGTSWRNVVISCQHPCNVRMITMQWTDDEQDEEQVHNILSHVIVHLRKGKNFAHAEQAATPAVLVYRFQNLVPPLQLDLVTFDYRLHGRSHIA
jgi:hypothetical protein